MSAVAVLEIAPGDLDGLHRAVQRRIGAELFLHVSDLAYRPLEARLRAVQAGLSSFDPAADRAAMESDLRELLTVPTETLRRMVQNEALNAKCVPKAFAQSQALMQVAEHHRNLQEISRPKLSPADLIGHFATRGVMIRAKNGNLHVSPAAALSEADRALLLANKPAILEALSAAVAVI